MQQVDQRSNVVPNIPDSDSRNVDEVAQIFIDVHLDARVKRDLAIWFAEHPTSKLLLMRW